LPSGIAENIGSSTSGFSLEADGNGKCSSLRHFGPDFEAGTSSFIAFFDFDLSFAVEPFRLLLLAVTEVDDD
jgi:hypothetical protein